MKDNKLHHLELEVMKKVWKLEQDTVNNVLDNINRKLAYTTIATTMRNLARKGFLSYTVLERTFLYQLLVKESEITHSMLSDLLERLFDNSAEKLVNTLLEIRQANPEEHNRLQQLIKDSQPRGNNDE
ncbi:TPA: BlaI/MecI/CopY family transcriptional regulator [Candidatus Poribacteria bacterium]|jgi:predicted transcriptional regulator|nr:BlaI/MecI/CopY family transcriptional regulator [Candidatus Poribacteria bacterium]HIC02025.1 BlaI/MecI/CopY family transcriptional regulator [Candidatus Poribacteria bacterium]HIO80214.1 BlaI/MecI/CopY family transcriptional regulator [Candidatus Poribacteria bacterium]